MNIAVDWKSVICHEGKVNLTYMALNLSHYVNGVAKRHGEVSRHLFPDSQIDAITNGVHAATWVSPPFEKLFDRHITDWRKDNFAFPCHIDDPHSPDTVWHAYRGIGCERSWKPPPTGKVMNERPRV